MVFGIRIKYHQCSLLNGVDSLYINENLKTHLLFACFEMLFKITITSPSRIISIYGALRGLSIYSSVKFGNPNSLPAFALEYLYPLLITRSDNFKNDTKTRTKQNEISSKLTLKFMFVSKF